MKASGNPYFTGGYSTRRHGSRDGGTVSGVQIEAHYTGIRNTSENRENFAEILTELLDIYFQEHFGWNGIVNSIPDLTYVPNKFELYPNYPNPFNMSTTIEFNIPSRGFVSINIYDITGRVVTRLLETNMSVGKHKIIWNASSTTDLSSGIYLCVVNFVGDKRYKSINKLTLIK